MALQPHPQGTREAAVEMVIMAMMAIITMEKIQMVEAVLCG